MNLIKSALIQSVIFCVCFPVNSFTQAIKPQSLSTSPEEVRYTISQQTSTDTLQNRPNSGLSIDGSFSFGTGGDKLIIGETTEGDDITLCTGGGIGMAITLGYNFFSKVDLDLTAGYQLNWNRPECDNMDGYFSRLPLLATAKYWIPTKNNTFIKLGGGIGYYTAIKYELEASESFGVHEIIKYNNATGFHVVGEYEIIGPEKPVSLVIGVKYSIVTYNASSFTINGTPVPTSDLRSVLQELKGSAFDFYFGIGYYF